MFHAGHPALFLHEAVKMAGREEGRKRRCLSSFSNGNSDPQWTMQQNPSKG